MDTHLETSGATAGGGPEPRLRITAVVCARRGWGGGKDAASHLGKTASGAKYRPC